MVAEDVRSHGEECGDAGRWDALHQPGHGTLFGLIPTLRRRTGSSA